MKKLKVPNIFDYKDYRKFLNDIFELNKAQDKNFTYGAWAKDIGLSSISGLTMVLKGQRDAGKNIQSLLIKNLKLDKEQAQYFSSLVKFQKQAKNDSNLLVYMVDNHKLEEKIEDSHRPLQFKWQMGFIREAVKWNDFNPNDDWLRQKSRFEVQPEELADILNEMKEEKMLIKSDDKYLVNESYRPLNLDTRYFQYLHKEFLRMVDNAYDIDFKKRALEYRMVVIKKDDVQKAKERIQEFLQSFIEEFDQRDISSEESDIYLTSLHLTPFSK
ncbi:TIGR02147 family protein [Bacteriovorax sp. Seq25_V]|uniref:TIGR02147 family protein n=1 Tax=Bacteriovorax sp. Seq25_V TaxID=1201288 RepID=UPI000389EF63|nr:TIGR02147 family protein [Bacteriovorax sp. Seq25_V]EQC44911.1 TIGR02147 family protein [Bacteriovorax sp. Seq25_V]